MDHFSVGVEKLSCLEVCWIAAPPPAVTPRAVIGRWPAKSLEDAADEFGFGGEGSNPPPKLKPPKKKEKKRIFFFKKNDKNKRIGSRPCGGGGKQTQTPN